MIYIPRYQTLCVYCKCKWVIMPYDKPWTGPAPSSQKYTLLSSTWPLEHQPSAIKCVMLTKLLARAGLYQVSSLHVLLGFLPIPGNI